MAIVQLCASFVTHSSGKNSANSALFAITQDGPCDLVIDWTIEFAVLALPLDTIGKGEDIAQLLNLLILLKEVY